MSEKKFVSRISLEKNNNCKQDWASIEVLANYSFFSLLHGAENYKANDNM